MHQAHKNVDLLDKLVAVHSLLVRDDLLAQRQGAIIKCKGLSLFTVDVARELIGQEDVSQGAFVVVAPVLKLVLLHHVEERLVVVGQMLVN